MFDCVLPTRNGRHGLAFTRFGPINLKNARHADDPRPLDAESRCPAARDYSRAYLHHLVKANETLAAMLLSLVNLFYYQDLMQGMRAAIAAGSFCGFRQHDSGGLGARRHSPRCDDVARRASTVGSAHDAKCARLAQVRPRDDRQRWPPKGEPA